MTIEVEEQVFCNSCWGSFTMEDKAAPAVDCAPISISCTDAIPAVGMGVTALDNCSNATVEITNESTDNTGLCDNGVGVVLTRTYVAIDAVGNVSTPCMQEITITRPSAVSFPADIAWYCGQLAENPNLTDATDLTCAGLTANPNLGESLDGTVLSDDACLNTSGSGTPSVAEGLFCNFAVSHQDEILTLCEGSDNTYKIIRTWAVLDWCTNTLVTFNDTNENGIQDAGEDDNVQIIKVVDNVEPVITLAADANTDLNANLNDAGPQGCTSTDELPIAIVTDGCSDVSYSVFTSVGEAIFAGNVPTVPFPGLSIGTHEVTYVATDACGNTSELVVTINVTDNVTPTAVCEELTQVAIGGGGEAVVFAETFDDGSNDNCGIDRFEVRKLDEDACDNDNVSNSSENEMFGESISFCCEEIGNSINVALRVYDYFGNFNECMVQVVVEDKIAPYKLNNVEDFTVGCDDYFSNLNPELDIAEANGNNNPAILIERFGEPIFEDNCSVIVTPSFSVDVNSCGAGTITRTWSSVDPSGNVGPTCTQTINLTHVNDWSVQFPADVDLDCIAGMDELEGADFGEPVVFDEDCELIAISSEDQLFSVVPDACYQIIRTYTAINWCQYDGTNLNDDVLRGTRRFEDGGNDSDAGIYSDDDFATTDDGVVIYSQKITVQDELAPVITAPTDLDFCIDGSTDGDCDRNINLPEVTVSDCSDDVSLTYTVEGLGTGLNYANVAPGTYEVLVTATDNCGNQSSSSYNFDVRDCKAPTPYCTSSLIVELMPIDENGDGLPDAGMVETWATDFNAGSFDNCTASENLAFRIAYNDVGFNNATPNLMADCSNVFPSNVNSVYLYVQDEAGNIDYCQTTLIVESVANVCPNIDEDPVISGVIETIDGEGVAMTTVEINTGMDTYTTEASGEYVFDVPTGEDYTVVPTNDLDHDNGVTTWDLVLIRQHILTTNLFDSPYKIIAADANNNQSVTMADVVALRMLILNPTIGLANNTSWRFVAANHEFANPTNPWSEGFPEIANFNNIASNVQADFVGVKVGDINGSALANFNSESGEERSQANLVFRTENERLIAGTTQTIEFTAAEAAVFGYQFTLNYDTDALRFVETGEGLAKAANFGTAFLSEGAITTSVDFATAKDLSDELVFSLTFEVLKNTETSDALSISSQVTKAEAYDMNGIMNVELAFNTNTDSEFALFANAPNPFSEMTKIRFNLPKASAAKLVVTDINGKIVEMIEGDFAAGSNEVEIRSIDVNGIYYYRLETETDSAVRKMVRTK